VICVELYKKTLKTKIWTFEVFFEEIFSPDSDLNDGIRVDMPDDISTKSLCDY